VSLKARALQWLKVPHEPEAPPGDSDVRVFRAAPSYFRYRVILWGLKQIAGVMGILFYLTFAPTWIPDFDRLHLGPFAVVTRPMLIAALSFFEIVGLVIYVFQAIGSALLLRLDYEQRWYLVSNRSLRIREGLVRLQERTMTFANVQHLAIHQNPIQRWLGISDVEVRSAGGGSGSTDGHEHDKANDLHTAYFRGVSDPERIRDVIRERLKSGGDAGLGDPDDAQSTAMHLVPDTGDATRLAIDAARLLRDEARALKEALSG
jgi:membrane protein YdbS with pleckstrin-like domain